MHILVEEFLADNVAFRKDCYETLIKHREEFIDWRPNWDLIQFLLAQLIPITSSSFKSIAATAHEIADHYDRGNDFFNAFLGPMMIYTSAFYQGLDQTLEQAQTNKLNMLCEKVMLKPGMTFLDIGCGIGGPARYVAEQVGCRVRGIDLTTDYIAAGNELCAWVGLSDQVTLEHASALKLPYDAERFDAAYVMHVGMNIADKHTMMAEAFRVLRPGGCLVVYDVMTTTADAVVTYPMPWSEVPENSAIDTPQSYENALMAAGFTIEKSEAYSDFAVTFFEGMMARMSDGPGPLGLHLLMGANTPEKIGNVYRQTKEGTVGPFLLTCRKPA